MDVYKYIHIVMFVKNVANFHLLTPEDSVSLPKAGGLYVNQNGNVSTVFNLFGIDCVNQVKYIFGITV
jgi:hypothetical protein